MAEAVEHAHYMSELREGLVQHFTSDEISLLAFELDVDWDELPGEIKSLKAQGLIRYLARQGRLTELLRLVQQKRNQFPWPSVPPPAQQIADEQALGVAVGSEVAYRDFVDALTQLQKDGLTESSEHEEARRAARSRTLEVLRETDGNHKGKTLRFLYESGLIGRPDPIYVVEPIILLEDAALNGAELRAASLVGADLGGTDLRQANLRQAVLRDAYLAGANLASADLSEADLRGVVLRRAELSGAKLRDSDLRSADLTDAVLEGADLTRARYNGQTIWPAQFDASAEGARGPGELE